MPWKNKEDRAKAARRRYLIRREEILKLRKEYNDTHKLDKKLYDAKRLSDPIKKQKMKDYQKENKNKINTQKKERLKNDPLFKLSKNIRSSINRAYKKSKFTKTNRTEEILGCSFLDFKLHLESQFETWMTYDNYGLCNNTYNYGWDIDHIIPISVAKTIEEVISLNHYTNLQPLCSHTNRNIKRDIY